MEALVKIFGPTEYKDRMGLIFTEVQDLPERHFAWICKHFSMTKSVKYPPLPEEFREAANLQRKHINEGMVSKRVSEELPIPSGEALDGVFKKLGVTNLSEAIKHREKIKNEEIQ